MSGKTLGGGRKQGAGALAGWVAAWCWLLAGCGGSERADLLLDVRTDLVSGAEFVRVRVERFEQVPEPGELASGVNVRERAAGLDEPFVSGVRAAVFENLKPGNHVVRARLIDGQNAIVLERIAILTVRRTSVFTLVMTRDCRGVQCPGPADDPSLLACVGGRCVRPECTPEQPEFCPSFSCEVDISCVAPAACGEALCTSEQVCLLSVNRAECPADQYCDPEEGCRALPGGSDAGLPDAGPVPDAGGFSRALQAYIKATNNEAVDQFGTSVALSSDGSTLAVGATTEDSAARGVEGDPADNSALSSGAVYVYTRSGTTWSPQAYIKATNTGAGDWFGTSVALSSDGSTLAVGAYREASGAEGVDGDPADNSSPESGAVYVYGRSGTAWSPQAYIKATNTGAGDWFGTSIALSSDGSTLAVGAYHEDSAATGVDGDETDNSARGSGAVYVYGRSGTTWSRQAYIKATNTGDPDLFGYSVALSADGSTLAVGAYNEASAATGVDGDETDNSASGSGAVYVYGRSGTTWSPHAYIKATTAGVGEQFGNALALSSDGSTLAVSAWYEDSAATGVDGNPADNSAFASGAVYVYTRSGTTWSPQAYIKATNTETLDQFGNALALSSDGSTLAVGAWQEDSAATGVDGDQMDNTAPQSGAVYVYGRSGTTWSPQAYIKASNTEVNDQFGTSVALSSGGSTLAVGAYHEDSAATGVEGDPTDNTASWSGAVYLYAF